MKLFIIKQRRQLRQLRHRNKTIDNIKHKSINNISSDNSNHFCHCNCNNDNNDNSCNNNELKNHIVNVKSATLFLNDLRETGTCNYVDKEPHNHHIHDHFRVKYAHTHDENGNNNDDGDDDSLQDWFPRLWRIIRKTCPELQIETVSLSPLTEVR